MAPDFTSFVLSTVYNDWGTGEATPPTRPTVIDRRTTARMGPREPDVRADLTENNAVGVDAVPTTTNTPTGFGFNYTYEGGAGVRIRGLNANEGGHIASIEEWEALKSEVRRTINAKRRWPIPDTDGGGGAFTARIDNENDMSQNYQDHFEYRLDVLFRGRERL